MEFSANLNFALPELILAGSALVLLVWGAFQGKTNVVFQIAAVGKNTPEALKVMDRAGWK